MKVDEASKMEAKFKLWHMILVGCLMLGGNILTVSNYFTRQELNVKMLVEKQSEDRIRLAAVAAEVALQNAKILTRDEAGEMRRQVATHERTLAVVQNDISTLKESTRTIGEKVELILREVRSR